MVRRVLRPRADPGRRLGATLLAIAFVMSLFVGRLVQLQGFESGKFVQIAEDQRLQTESLPAVRGNVTAADGQALAITVETYLVYADPVMMSAAQLPEVAADLAGPLGMTEPDILGLLQHPTSPQYVVLKKNVSQQTADQIKALELPGATGTGAAGGTGTTTTGSGLPGVQLQASYSRVYPDGDATSNLLGFTHPTVSGNLTGAAGLEYSDNALLAGQAGSEQFQVGTLGEQIPLAADKNTPTVNGSGLRLTIIPALQWEAQQACEQQVRTSDADDCTVVIMQPSTGKVLAMAQWPAYNPGVSSNPLASSNLAVQDVFEPGSTGKVITASAAIEKGGQRITSTYTVPDAITEDGYPFRDAEYHPVERWTIAGILANSSNDGMVQVVRHVSPQTQYDYFKAFGIDSPTGLNLPGESQGILPSPSAWWGDERYTLSFGQGVDVNAVQMASVYSTIANQGVRVQPTLVAGSTNSAGKYTAGPGVPVAAGHPGQHGPQPHRGPAAGARGRRGSQRAVGHHPRLRDRGQDRHLPGVERHQEVPVQVRRQLHRDGAREQPAGRGGGQRAEPEEGRLLRRRGGRPGLLQGHDVRVADPQDSAAWDPACGRAAHRALIGGNLSACPWPSVPAELCAALSPAWARCSR